MQRYSQTTPIPTKEQWEALVKGAGAGRERREPGRAVMLAAYRAATTPAERQEILTEWRSRQRVRRR